MGQRMNIGELMAVEQGLASIHTMISEQAARVGERPAVHCGGRTLNYRELDARSNQLARHLVKRGVAPGVLVGIYIERSVEMMVALLGVLKAGGAYVPLDPAYPRERIEYMLEDSAAPIVLTQASLTDALPVADVERLCLDSDWDDIGGESEQALEAIASEDDLAYVIYTSGSTGRPKGVAIPHRALSNFMLSMRDEPGLGEDDRLLAVTTLSFDIAGLELYLPLIVGAQLFIASREDASDGNRLAREIAQHQINVMQATPASWRLLLEAQWPGDPQLKVLCGGEALTRELAQRLLPRAKELWNLYGPTETTIWSTLHKVTSGTGTVPIGHPIANTELVLLGEDGQPVSDDADGELYIGGDGLAQGYFKRPDLTAERFVPHPHHPQRRLYRTGDRARFGANGDLEHLGRVDFQVKVRGFRIELGEIESVLDHHPQVNQSVVVAREDTPGDKRLVAYVVPAGDASPSTRDLRAQLAESLPDYMVPGVFVTLDTFPMTPNGKVDRNALPVPDVSLVERTEEFRAPRNDDEAKMCRIWGEVLRADPVGIDDNFFELGGDSLKVAQVATRIRETFRVEMPLRWVFESPTVAALMPQIDRAEKLTAAAKELPISQVVRGEHIPPSFAQERVWFLHQLNPQNLAYNFQSSIAFKGELDIKALERSLGEILRRHESYRTSFPTVDGKPVQVVHPYDGYRLKVIDLRKKSASEQQAATRAWEQGEFQLRFDLAQVPLVRWTLFRYGDNDNMLIHMEHHLVHDGWSFNVFMCELVELYKAYANGEESPLPELPVQFAEFATWQREWMRGEVSDRQLNYWRERFKTIPPLLELPTKGPRPAAQTFRGASLRPEIDLDLCNALRALSRQQGSTLFMTMLAGFMALLHRYTGEEDIAVGTFFANRRQSESESLIGMILNNVVIRASLDANPTAREFITTVRNLVLEGANYQDVPFDRVVEAVQPKRDLSMNPLFQVMFSFHDEPMPEEGIEGLDVKLTPVLSNGSAKFDLGVIGIPHSAQYLGLPQGSDRDGLTMIWEHNTDLFETETIDRMVEHYKSLLASIVENPDLRLSELCLVPRDEQDELLVELNDTARAVEGEPLLHERIASQAARTPNDVAVCYKDRSLTYQQLDEGSNQLARVLLERGAGPGELVAICVERSEQMLIGLLGILKTGAAYLPIDPAFPAERQSYMLEDAGVKLTVSESAVAARLGLDGEQVVTLDGDSALIGQASAQAVPAANIGPQDVAYVIYTSGSTGHPKGVRIPHRAVVNFLASMAEEPGIEATDRLMAVTTLSFDIAGLELYLPLCVGARVVICPREITADGQALARHFEQSGATMCQATPTTWQMLLDAGWQGREGFKVLCGGEALPYTLAEKLLPAARGGLWNMYGPTETTIWSTIHRLQPTDQGVPIGRPIDNTQAYVLDRYDNLAPVGAVGELCIGGAGVGLGYLNRAELTAERFIDNPVAGASSPIYRTGDLARVRGDGTLECLGRTDTQVKLRGFRIELGEIESQLERLASIQQAVVVVREDTPGDARLVAYVRSTAEAPSHGEWVNALRGQLPDYMVPGLFEVMESLPLTPNGKIDRKALPVPSGVRKTTSSEFVAPRTGAETTMQAIWQEVLGVSPISVHDDFFDIGGHSILAVRLVSEIEKRTGTRIELAALLQGRTIERTATFLAGHDAPVAARPALQSAFMALKPEGNSAPFFAGGSHPKYLNVARELGGDRPFYRLDLYALQSQRLADGLAPLRRIEDFASYFVQEIRKVQPHGPYYLGGGCDGAYCAFEMALQLQRQGEDIGALVMWIPPPLRSSHAFSLHHSAPMLLARQARALLSRGALQGLNSRSAKVLLKHERIDYSIMRAVNDYLPSARFNGKLTIVRTEHSPVSSAGDLNKPWAERASEGADVHVVRGSHDTWFDDYLQDFAAVLRASLKPA